MGRKKSEIQPIRGIRLNELLKEKKWHQTDLIKALSEKVIVTPQHLSHIVTGKANLTDALADDILGLFPYVRRNWLMGYDDYKTDYDWADALHDNRELSHNSQWRIIEDAAKKQGMKIVCVWKRQPSHIDYETQLEYSRKGLCWYEVQKEGHTIKKLSVVDFFEMEQQLVKYADFLFWEMIGGIDDGKHPKKK